MNTKNISYFIITFLLFSVLANGQIDLALVKSLASGQSNIVSPGDNVTFTIEVTNQGMVPLSQVALIDYVPNVLILNDPNWVMIGSRAEILLTTTPGPFQPGTFFSFNINFTVSTTASTTIVTNAAEIAFVRLTDGTIVSDDIDSTFDSDDSNDGISINDAVVNPADEDDHDIETITIVIGNNTDVYPGDLNYDGIVNYIDHGLIGLYKTEIGPPRAVVHQNTQWYPHPAQDWDTEQLNNQDIKHFDCNGDGFIDNDDRQVVQDNMGEKWTIPIPTPPSPNESEYQVLLHPIEQISNDYLVMNIALEKRTGGDLNLQGGFFTIDFSDIEANINYAVLGLFDQSWLGERNNNLRYEINELPAEKKIEIGFNKTDNLNSTGSGVIGDLILSLDNSDARFADTLIGIFQIKVKNIGVHNSLELIPIEDKVLQVNVGSNKCLSNLTINEDTPFQNEYHSNNMIETEGFLIIGERQEVVYQSNIVSLLPGFEVKVGANFKVDYGECD